MRKSLALIPKSFKEQLIYSAGIVLTKIVAIIMLPMFTYYLTPADYARLDIIQTLANLASLVIAFGLSDSLFRFAGETSKSEVRTHMAANIFALAIIALFLGTLCTQLLAPLISRLLPGEISLFQTRTILASLAVTACITVPLAWLRMQGKAGLFFLATAGWAISQAVVTAVALFLGYGVDGVLLSGLFCSVFLAIVLSIYQYYSTGVSFSPSLSLAQARFGGMLVLAGIAAFIIESSGRWMLASEAGVQVLAEYALAWKVGIMALLFTEPFVMWWLPKRFTVLSEQGKQQCASITEIGVVIALISVVAIACAGPFLVTILSPKEYHNAIQYIPAFAVLAGIKAATNLFTTGILTEKKTLWPIYIDSGTAVIALAGNFIFIPYFQAWGAIFSLTIALILRFFLYLYIGQSVSFIPYQLYRMGLLLFITLAIPVIACQAENPIITLLLGFLGGGLLLLCAVIFGSIPVEKLRVLFTATHISSQASLARKK